MQIMRHLCQWGLGRWNKYELVVRSFLSRLSRDIAYARRWFSLTFDQKTQYTVTSAFWLSWNLERINHNRRCCVPLNFHQKTQTKCFKRTKWQNQAVISSDRRERKFRSLTRFWRETGVRPAQHGSRAVRFGKALGGAHRLRVKWNKLRSSWTTQTGLTSYVTYHYMLRSKQDFRHVNKFPAQKQKV